MIIHYNYNYIDNIYLICLNVFIFICIFSQKRVIERIEAKVRQSQQRLTTLINERMGKDDKVKLARVVKVIERIGEGEEAIQVVRVSLLEDPKHLMIRTVLGMVRQGDVLTLLLPEV